MSALYRRALTLGDAMYLVSASVRLTRSLGLECAVCVSDSHGLVIAQVRTDHVDVFAVGMAVTKSFTAATLRMSSSALAPFSESHGPLVGIDSVGGGAITTIAGGEPLSLGGEPVGGLGVSGGSPDEDRKIALAAIEQWLTAAEQPEWPEPL